LIVTTRGLVEVAKPHISIDPRRLQLDSFQKCGFSEYRLAPTEVHHPEQVLEASRGGYQGDLLRDAAEGNVELLFNNGHAGELAQRFDISGRQGEGGFEFFLRL